MPRVSLAFFTTAALTALAGMMWGVVMGIQKDFALSPAHAHLNLAGWASLAIMGTFYALRGEGGRLAWVNFALSATGAVVMPAFLAMELQGEASAEPGVAVGSILVVLGMVAFVLSVLGSWRKPAAA